jgi:S-adenosylmethionine:tRNA ribosyltransferase-isomerase
MISLDFELPAELAAHEPPEARGLTRDAVRLMVTRMSDDSIVHTRFKSLPAHLRPGDLLIVNTSATINAAFAGIRDTGEKIALHLSTPLEGDRWVIELRRLDRAGSAPLLDADAGEGIRLPAGGTARLIAPYRGSSRLWIAQLDVRRGVLEYAKRQGTPIRYAYVDRPWPLPYYQTVFAREPGSVEMPSAGRAFTNEIVHQLERTGVQIAPITLHAGVSSLDADEEPYPERYRVPRHTAAAINRARANGNRVIAVGTTVVRAIESAATPDGRVEAGLGWTELVITPERGLYAIDGLLTGLHAPNASHLWMLEALAGREHIARAYEAAIDARYLWHEFGDLHLIL